jgi:hypothetical protein
MAHLNAAQMGHVARCAFCVSCQESDNLVTFLSLFRCSRWHNSNLNQKVPVNFRHLQETVDCSVQTGDEPFQHVFRQETPADVVGAVSEVEESDNFVMF